MLDEWISTNLTTLHTHLDTKVSPEGSLAEIEIRHSERVPGCGPDLTSTQLARPPREETSGSPRDAGTTSEFSSFVASFCEQPVAERLRARSWLPLTQLSKLRTVARLRVDIHDLSEDVLLAHNFASHRTCASNCLLDIDNTMDLIDALRVELVHTHELIRGIRTATVINRFRSHILGLVNDLKSETNLLVELDRRHSREHQQGEPDENGMPDDKKHVSWLLVNAKRRAYGLYRDLRKLSDDIKPVKEPYTASHPNAKLLARVLEHDHQLVYGRTGGADFVARRFDKTLHMAFERLESAVTDMDGIDLNGVPLDNVPLTGLKWSYQTRWPAKWNGEIRKRSKVVEAKGAPVVPKSNLDDTSKEWVIQPEEGVSDHDDTDVMV
jgi:hypothetical protein